MSNVPSLKVGDTILFGKYLNRRATIEGFGTDDNGQPTVKTDQGELRVFHFRVEKLMEDLQVRVSESKGVILVDGRKFVWENDPQSGKLDMYLPDDEGGDHIGQAPNAAEAEKFIRKEVKNGNLKESRMSKARAITKLVESVQLDEASPKIGGRQLASDSDRAKYAGIKKKIDDLEKKKTEINAAWEKEQDDKKRVALYDQKAKIRDQIEPLEKQRKAMLSKYRGIQSRSSK